MNEVIHVVVVDRTRHIYIYIFPFLPLSFLFLFSTFTELAECVDEMTGYEKGTERSVKLIDESIEESNNDGGSIGLLETDSGDVVLFRQETQLGQQQQQKQQQQQRQRHQLYQLPYEKHGSEEGGDMVGVLEAGQQEIENGAVAEASDAEPVEIPVSPEQGNDVDDAYGVHSLGFNTQDPLVRER